MTNQIYNKSGQLELLPIPYNTAELLLIRSGIKFYSYQCFSIPAPIVSRYFNTYKLLYWSGHHLLDQIIAGTITRNDVAYRVVYRNQLTRGYILQNRDEQYSLSFRESYDAWNIEPVVIISRSI